jgi:hypothetical protein
MGHQVSVLHSHENREHKQCDRQRQNGGSFNKAWNEEANQAERQRDQRQERRKEGALTSHDE